MKVTMTQVAQESGVSVALVSRLLRGDPTVRVSPERREQVLAVAERLGGVKPRHRRRTQVSTGQIVVPCHRLFMSNWSSMGFMDSPMVRALESTLLPARLRLSVMFFDDEDRKPFYDSITSGATRSAGVLILSGEATDWLADLIRARAMPHVSPAYDAERLTLNTVRAHVADGLRQAVEHLAALGHRRICYLGPRNSYRYPLVAMALVQAGLPFDESKQVFCNPVEAGRPQTDLRPLAQEAIDAWLQGDRFCTAMICANDHVAQGAVDALRAAGLQPGRDLSLVGHDNLEQHCAEPVNQPTLTTVDYPHDRIGQRMAHLLINQIVHGQLDVIHERVPTQLIVRSSTGPVPSP